MNFQEAMTAILVARQELALLDGPVHYYDEYMEHPGRRKAGVTQEQLNTLKRMKTQQKYFENLLKTAYYELGLGALPEDIYVTNPF